MKRFVSLLRMMIHRRMHFITLLIVTMTFCGLYAWMNRVQLDQNIKYEKQIYLLKGLLEEAQSHADYIVREQLEISFSSKGVDQIPTSTVHQTTSFWLSVAIPTLPRDNDPDYLLQALASWAIELPAVNTGRSPQHWVHLQIVNVYGHGHTRFDQAKSLYSRSPFMQFRTMVLNETTDKKRDMGSRNRPGWRVRRQTRHVVATILSVQNQSKFFLFLEDDMQLCPHALKVLSYIISRASLLYPNFMAIRTSFGLNGIIIHNSDMQHLADYLMKHRADRPPDHLIVAWFAGEEPDTQQYRGKRQHIGYRYNLMRHLGATSTLRPQSSDINKMPQCYEELLVPIVFPIEAYSPKKCPADDFTPCENGAAYPPLLFGKLLREEKKLPDSTRPNNKYVERIQQRRIAGRPRRPSSPP